MAKNVPFPITEENLPECWEYVDKRRRIARKMSAIAGIGKFVINLLFLWILIFIACGLLYERVDSPFREFWESLFLFPYWEAVRAQLLIPGDSIWADIGRLVPTAYLLSAVAFLLLAVCIHLLYHPFKKKMPEGTYAENTDLLAKQAQEAREASYSTRSSTSIAATLLAVVTIFFILFGFTIYVQDAPYITALLTIFPTKDYQTNCLIYVLILYAISDIVCSILMFITLPIYRYEFPYDFVVQAEQAAIYAWENTQDLTPEELAEKRTADAVKLRKEALELEKENAYNVAKRMLLQAAICSDVPAMEHYARHCLLSHMNSSAGYWLKKAVASGEASPEAKKMLLRLRLHLRHNVEYLKPEEAPLSTGKKILRALWTVITVLWKLLVVALLIGSILMCVMLYKASTNPEAYAEFSSTITELFPQESIPTE